MNTPPVAIGEGNLTPRYIQDWVDQALTAYADRTAVVFNGEQLTYNQLARQAEQVSQAILGGQPDADIIALSTTRSLNLVGNLLGILKAGKAYLPLDPSYPTARLAQLITDSGVTACVGADEEAPFFDEIGLIIVQKNAELITANQPIGTKSDTACVLYTSGSTGRPKGVCLTHAGLIDLLNWQLKTWENTSLNTLQFCHLSFDASVQEILVPLLSGGTIHLVEEAVRLDAGRLISYIQERAIGRVFLPYVVLSYLADAAHATQTYPASLREIITGGELLKITPAIARFFAEIPACSLLNVYGPTEASVWVTELRLDGDPLQWPEIPTIGSPVAGRGVWILDETGLPVADGEVGEICLTGACLAAGYLNQPDRTAEQFIQWTAPDGTTHRMYKTGDLALRQPDGTLVFQGRRDGQVKIRGNRVEVGEIEAVLAKQPAVQQAVVIAREDVPGQKRLVAYLVAAETVDLNAIRHTLADTLPDFMLPAHFVVLPELPRTTSGKVDRLSLPKPSSQRPALSVLYRAPRTATEHVLSALWMNLLQLDQVGSDDNFFDLGGNSLLAQQTVAQLAQQHGLTLPVTKLYQFPTVAGIARFLDQPDANIGPKAALQPTKARFSGENRDVAVIGMAGRFPGAGTIAELWDVLREGRETTRFFTPDELDPSIPATVRHSPDYVAARGVIDGADGFDAPFFGLNPRLAEVMDPQQRIFLEIAYEVLEETGYRTGSATDNIGVWAGCGNNTYYLNNVLTNPRPVAQVGAFQAMTVNEKDYIASRTAYQLNLKGPAVSVYSACSTSLLAISQAVEALRAGQCTVALAGGASITAPINSGHIYEEGAMFSRDGHTRSFNAGSSGTVFSDGAGVVLLKTLADAERDGDTILAVIKGVGVNNDGGGKGSFTAPSAEGQAEAIRQALHDGQIDPATISYVEAHGTATPLGDPIEIEGLTMAFGPDVPVGNCAIGSIKSNMGHLTQAAGVAGLIKTVLALQHRQLPASLGYDTPNPHINFANSPFVVNASLTNWQSDDRRRAGVSSFGVGGTNVHVVLEEYAAETTPKAAPQPRLYQLLTWSARSENSREAYATKLAHHLDANPDSLADAAFTLQTTRPDFAQRRFVVAFSADDAILQLTAQNPASGTAGEVRAVPQTVVFMFPGQGAQYPGMGRELYENESVFRQAVDDCAALLHPHLEADIRTVLYPETSDATGRERLKNTRYAQPGLFVTNYALACLWQSWGIDPTVMCGHSLGEFVAAHLAGVFTLADALRLVATRGQQIGSLPRGSMLSVKMGEAALLPILPEVLSIAAINSPTVCVVSGPDEAVAQFAQQLDAQSVSNRVLETSHAFHSAMMDSVVEPFAELVRSIPLGIPKRPIISTVTGTWLTDEQATDPAYWARHLRQTVRFADAVATALTLPTPLVLEVGPGTTLSTLTRQQAGTAPVSVVTSLATRPDKQPETVSVLTALGQLWRYGLAPDWTAFYADRNPVRISLPTYAFDRKRCWLDPPTNAVPLPTTDGAFPENKPLQVTAVDSSAHNPVTAAPIMRKDHLLTTVKNLLEDASGIELADVRPDATFLEIGLDSLLLTQVATTLKKEFGVPLTFRQLNDDCGTLDGLVNYLDTTLPTDQFQPPIAQPHTPQPATFAQNTAMPASAPGGETAMELIAQQLQLLARQVALLQTWNVTQPAPVQPVSAPAAPKTVLPVIGAKPDQKVNSLAELSPEEAAEIKKPFGATARIERQATELSPSQSAFLQALTTRYNQKTAGSKAYTQQHRAHMADPRVVSGFKPLTKEIVYPLVVNRSQGSRLWDIDGNEYIDVLNGFGSTMFGYQPDFMKQALHDQIERGFEIGPQHELAGEVSELFCEMTGAERAALCSTGSEAVLGAMRIARTVTGRSLIVAFTGSYHGIVDEVLVRGTRKLKTFPAASGIMPEAVQNMLILDYGTDESLRIIRERAHELAAVLVEPVQSRRPEFRPIAFLQDVRAITEAAGTALIFDEVITGFRMHPGGAQALFGIRADIASYGKVVGGGLPIGVIAGKKAFMDALDGGTWQFGDDSFPEVGVTYFAGTFVRHPLALAAAKASLLHLKEMGPALQQGLTAKASHLAKTLNADFERQQLPFFIAQFGSLWKIKFTEDVPYSELLFTLMREAGIHIWDGFPCFMTEAHTDDEVEQIIAVCRQSVAAMIEAGFFKTAPTASQGIIPNGNGHYQTAQPVLETAAIGVDQPPLPGARLGRDRAGNPAWFIANPDKPGSYLQVE
ncbi:amino acid adenylation domain-containing protein [Fibrella sp. HMF5335]|uniref:Amino acid adenylation domain-containing protein n=1 Tax=Fibrella rubiginis TaxID=2817060 RepID=A0A939GD21_9BACT|nr:polyketide synthase [Fibrella rubiginis]MBO0935548.1 amino acid adenylation domain-containing protein [Fibrella rubiginis]